MSEQEKLKIEHFPIPIDHAYLSVRTESALRNKGIKTLNELAEYTTRDFLSWKNVGKKSLKELREKLAFYGLSLKDETVNLDIKKTILVDLPKTLKEMKWQLDHMVNELYSFAHKIDQIATYAEKTKEKIE